MNTQTGESNTTIPDTATSPQPIHKIVTQIPEHLLALYHQLDWVGQSIDHLAQQLDLEIAVLTAYLMELELMGLAMQQSGLYLRCRPHK